MQYEMQLFEYEDKSEFRVIDRNGEPWFVLSEVCRELEVNNVSDAASRLDEDEKDNVDIIDAIGRNRKTLIINESGLYSLILTSRKPAAKRFKKWVTSEVLPSIRKTGRYGGKLPAFIRRYNENWDRVAPGYFSVCSELAIRVWGRLEQVGHIMADRASNGVEIRPDVSVGRGFADWLRVKHPDAADDYTLYLHKTPEAEIEARQYPNKYLPLFIEYVDTVWIPEKARDYFKTRDPAALPYLPLLLPAPEKQKRLARA
ncbi:MAG: BRO-N domain-containing protein [Caulobacterales bacterium]|uniref:BRO-N domain-containing protein n=1 Tax=Glycocaulis sp. TaxID=1969725 RepID=UPI003FA07C03